MELKGVKEKNTLDIAKHKVSDFFLIRSFGSGFHLMLCHLRHVVASYELIPWPRIPGGKGSEMAIGA